MEHHPHARLRGLPGGLATRETAADDVNFSNLLIHKYNLSTTSFTSPCLAAMAQV
jgi:hypothetical protein